VVHVGQSRREAGVRDARSTILVVEDDEPLVDLLRRVLARADYAVESADNGAAGLARIERGDVDVVLLDLVLPDGSGLDLCRHVRAQPAAGHLPIIMLTGLCSDLERRAGFAAGADDYITKPFQTAELLDRVRVWTRARQYLRAGPADTRAAAVRDQLVRDEALLAMMRTAIHEWARLSALLPRLLGLWEANLYSPAAVARLRSEFQGAADDLAERLAALGDDLAPPGAGPRVN
jgi:DNA-binding response OmpR family regulator